SDEDTIANRLEELLERTRGPLARPVVCRTVAMARWNHRNAVQFVLDHLDELRPDLAVYLPFMNDLSDTLIEGGDPEPYPDPASPDPWLPVRSHVTARLLAHLIASRDGGLAGLDAGDFGPDALTSDLSPESSRRYDEDVASIARLSEVLAARGAS